LLNILPSQKKKVLLINVADPWLTNGGDRPSLGTLYLATWLKHTNSAEASVIDLNHYSNEELKERINDFKPDFIGISLTTPQYEESIKVASFIKERFSIPIIAGGSHPTAMLNVKSVPELMPIYLFDYIVIGSGEKALEKICIEGLPKERIIYGEEIKSKNLDWLPFPDRSFVDMNKYSLHILGKKATPIMTSFGCPHSCIFCSEPILNRLFKSFSPEKVIQEMEILNKDYGIESFIIYDDVFSINTKRAISIADLMIQKQLPFTYRCTTRATDFIRSKELSKKLKNSGCVEVCIGTESGDNNILKESDKGMSIENNSLGLKIVKEEGMRCLTYMITGLPSCSKESEQKSLDFIFENVPNEVGWYLLAPFPSTPLWIYREKYGLRIFEDEIIKNNWDVAQCKANNENLTCYIDYSEKGGLNRYEIKELWLSMRDNLDKWQKQRGFNSIQESDKNIMDFVK
jgi:radical SAM superfamily enzyme YgiQ (UPF0313 family)